MQGKVLDLEHIIRQMARRIAEQFRPERIILFGSLAKGDWTSDSDIDLLIIVRELKNRRALRAAIKRTVNGMGLPKDIIVLTKEEFEMKRSIPGTIAYPADKEGRLLYAS